MYNSVALTTVTLLDRQHHHPSPELFHLPKQNPTPIKKPFPL